MSTTAAISGEIAADARVVVDTDRLRATVAPLTGFSAADVNLRQLEERISQAGLTLSAEAREELAARSDNNHLIIDSPILIAAGTAPVDECPARIEPIHDALPADDATPCDHYHRSRIRTVRAGQVVAKLLPATPGRDGLDIFGTPIPFKPAPPFHPALGPNVTLDQPSGNITATCDGSLKIDGPAISVENCLHLKTGVDFSTGNVYFGGDLVIDGSVADCFEVKARNVTVHKAIEGAHVTAAKHLHADGGIIGKEKARVLAGEELAVRFITSATVLCGGSVTVLNEISNSTVACRGKLTLVKGTVLHSKISAAGGVVARSIGSAAESRTVVEVGVTEERVRDIGRRYAELHDRRVQDARMRSQLERALAHAGRLTEPQKAKATTLMAHLMKQERDHREKLAALAAEWRDLLAGTHAEIEVHDRVWPGAVLRLAGLEVELKEPIKGPIRFVVRESAWDRSVVGILLSRHGELPLGGVETDTREMVRKLGTLDSKT